MDRVAQSAHTHTHATNVKKQRSLRTICPCSCFVLVVKERLCLSAREIAIRTMKIMVI